VAALLALTAPATAADITDVRWDGFDLLLRLSDSVPYRVDLTESDTSTVVVRLSNVAAPTTLSTTLNGPDGRAMILTHAEGRGIRVTLTSPERIGYATNWRPYSKTLVVHTFRWTQLGFAEEQYFKGLLAIEQRLNAQGIEYLRLAHAAGDPRAASTLGTYYARRNEYALAAQYLNHPLDADDYAALAAVKRSMGDTAAALIAEETSRQSLERRQAGVPARDPIGPTQPSGASEPTFVDRWVGSGYLPIVLAAIGGVILVTLLIVVVARRPRSVPPNRGHDDRVVSTRPADAPRAEPVAPAVAQRTPSQSASVESSLADHPPGTSGATPTGESSASFIESDLSDESTIGTASSIEGVADRGGAVLLSQQALELRQRIEALRTEHGVTESSQAHDESDASHAIMEEARRLHLSRDSVELRNRLHKVR